VRGARQRAERHWEIESYGAAARADRRRLAWKAAAVFAFGAAVMLLLARELSSPLRALGCCAVAAGLLAGAAIVLRAAPSPRRPAARRRRRTLGVVRDP
jgi:hypothetical protein